jgi:hypothetical protein
MQRQGIPSFPFLRHEKEEKESSLQSRASVTSFSVIGRTLSGDEDKTYDYQHIAREVPVLFERDTSS